MTQKSQNQSDSTEKITVEDVEHYDELTELDYEQATDELKLRHCAEVHSGKDFRNVLDAVELLTVKIGDE